MFGNAKETPQNENTLFYPRSPCEISKVAGFHFARNYRDVYGIHASNGILFNHESPRRGFEFVTRKISSHAAKIKLGLEKRLQLGNLDARRDWGQAKEYVKAMWLTLQQDEPDDYVIASEESHSVQEFAELAFSYLGLAYKDFVETDPKFFRPAEVYSLTGDSSKARKKLGWNYQYKFEDLVATMVESDLRLYEAGKAALNT